ncbi:MAG: hypothetical protein KAQ83_01080 [Nanoarchaeota archaeon]|nr:hypothetical protein [Nanoarchaeota archaeon]
MKFITIILLILLIPLAKAENLTEKDISIEIIIPDQIILNQTYTNLFKLTNNNHTSGITDSIQTITNYQITNTTINSTFIITINSHKSSGTGKFQITKPGIFQLCGIIINSSHSDNNNLNNQACKNFTIINPNLIYCNISINLTTDKQIYNNHEQIKYNHQINNPSHQFIIEYWIEDLFNNIIKSKTNTTNLNQKSYTPNIEEQEKTLILKNQLYINSCINSGKTNSQKIITIKNNNTKPENSTLTIDSYPNTADFGDAINIELSVYKGNTAKQVIYLWLEKDNIISEKSKVKVLNKYTEYSFSVPIQIKPDCTDKYETDFYNLIIEGLSQKIIEEIKVKKAQTSLCKTEYIETESETPTTIQQSITLSKPKFTYTIHNLPENIYINQSFNITLNFTNTESQNHNISTHAYIYQSSKCFSLSRTHNNYSLQLPKDTSKLITLIITNINTQNQSYNLKVKIKKNKLKTYKEITITLPKFKFNSQSNNPMPHSTIITNQTKSLFSKNQNTESINLLPTGMLIVNTPNITVFESTKQKTNNYSPYILIVILLLLAIIIYKYKKPIFSRR